MAQTTLEKLKSRLGALKNERTDWDAEYRDISRNLSPRRGSFLGENRRARSGAKRIRDNAPIIAKRTAVAGLMSGITNPTQQWVQFGLDDRDLEQYDPVKDWLSEVSRIISSLYAGSNFYSGMPIIFDESLSFGTACLTQHEDFNNVFRFRPLTIGEYYLANDGNDMPTTVYREYETTVENAYSRWPKVVSPQTKLAYDNGNIDHMVTIVQAIEPSARHIGNEQIASQFDIISAHWEKGRDNGKFLEIGGYNEHPAPAFRWSPSWPDAYGQGPGHQSLPDMKELQYYKELEAQALQQHGNPAMQGSGKGLNRSPGAYNEVKVGDNTGYRSIYGTLPNIDAIRAAILDKKEQINQTFYADLFRLFDQLAGVQPRNQMEIAERSAEKLIQLGPMLSQFDNELLDPTVERSFNILMRGSVSTWPLGFGLVPPPPDELRGREIKIRYISTLHRAQTAAKLGNFAQFANVVATAGTIDQGALDKFDGDSYVEESARVLNVPPAMVRGEEEVAEMRQARAQAQQQAQMAEAASTTADVISKVSA